MRKRSSVLILSMALAATVLVVRGEDSSQPGRDLNLEVKKLRAMSLNDIEAHARVFMGSLSAGEVEVIRPMILNLPATPINEGLASELLERWAELDGPAAYAYAANSASVWRTKHESRALVGWAKHDPRAAWDKLMVISNRGADPRYDEQQVMAAVAEANMSLALDFYEDLTSLRSCLMCNAAMITTIALHTDQLPLVAGAITRMSKGQTRDALRDGYWEILGQYLQNLALADVTKVPGAEDRRAAQAHLAIGWSTTDFEAALEHVLANYDTEASEQALLPMIQRWTVGAVPEEVAALIKKLPPNLTERSLMGLAPLLARVDPEAATRWAISLPKSEVRKECIQRAMWQWAQIDAEGAYRCYKEQDDIDTAGHLLWNYLLARVGNNTLRLPDLEEVSDRFYVKWRVSLLSKITLQLADPSVNHSGSFDLKAYATWVRSQKDYSVDQQEEILRPINSASNSSGN